MDNVTNNLSFDQLPKAVGELLTKVDYVISRLDEKKDADGASTAQDDDQMMTMDEACQFIGKKRSTMYSLTSERRIPYRKRGNKLYFFKKELVEWIQSGGAYDKPYTLSEQEQAGSVLSAKCSQYPKVVFKVFGGASIGFASHKTTAQRADISQMSHPEIYNV